HANAKDYGEHNACERPDNHGPTEGASVRWHRVGQHRHRSKAAIHQHEDQADSEGARKSMGLRLFRCICLTFLAQNKPEIWMSFAMRSGHRLCAHSSGRRLNGLLTGLDRQSAWRPRVLLGGDVILRGRSVAAHLEAPALRVFVNSGINDCPSPPAPAAPCESPSSRATPP